MRTGGLSIGGVGQVRRRAAGAPLVPYDELSNFDSGYGAWTDASTGARWDRDTNATPSGGSRPLGPTGPAGGTHYVFWEGSNSGGITGPEALNYTPDISALTGLRVEFYWLWDVVIENAGGVDYPDNADGLAPALEALISGVWTNLFTMTQSVLGPRAWAFESIPVPDSATALRFAVNKSSSINVWNSDPALDEIRVTNQP